MLVMKVLKVKFEMGSIMAKDSLTVKFHICVFSDPAVL